MPSNNAFDWPRNFSAGFSPRFSLSPLLQPSLTLAMPDYSLYTAMQPLGS